ncbi:hypothetical protein CVT24_009828 [Panaeolus cyanescens]|uniref:Uncharacterized protein n=1 Tax=Panaeolus cyanescens TaxID=181874 RepID=A0A409WF81_9AGAR|nr:hypothetical protein CVT24_009828 [Panaeolus cyanescens]
MSTNHPASASSGAGSQAPPASSSDGGGPTRITISEAPLVVQQNPELQRWIENLVTSQANQLANQLASEQIARAHERVASLEEETVARARAVVDVTRKAEAERKRGEMLQKKLGMYQKRKRTGTGGGPLSKRANTAKGKEKASDSGPGTSGSRHEALTTDDDNRMQDIGDNGNQRNPHSQGAAGSGTTGLDPPRHPSSKPAQNVGGSRHATKKKASQIHRLLNSEYPPETKPLKKAFETHIRLLWGMVEKQSVPPTASPAKILEFNQRVSSTTNDNAADTANANDPPSEMDLTNRQAIIPISTTTISPATTSQIQRYMRGIEDHVISYLRGSLARAGLSEWRPDLNQTSSSLYNSLHRMVAIDNFRQAVIGGGYDHMLQDTHYLSDSGLLSKFYNGLVHYRYLKRFNRNAQDPGSVEAADEMSPVYKNRERLAAARRKFLRDNGYPARYRQLITTKATSDDELAPDEAQTLRGKQIYYIKTRPERSPAVNSFIRRIDEMREQMTKFGSKATVVKRIRQPPPPDRDVDHQTSFLQLPRNMPIDYFKPSFYNSLLPVLRCKVADPSVIALRPNTTDWFDEDDPDLRLKSDKFFEKYQAYVLPLYKIPSDELLAGIDEPSSEEDISELEF